MESTPLTVVNVKTSDFLFR